MSNNTDTEAWYRQFWPWFIMIPPFGAIVGCAITIWLALTNPLQLAVEDYSRIDEINEQNYQMEAAAEAMGLSARLQLDQLDGSNNRNLSLYLASTGNTELPGQVLLVLTHTTKPEHDRSTLLVLDGERYRGTVDVNLGKYTLRLEDIDKQWRLSTTVFDSVQTVTIGNENADGSATN